MEELSRTDFADAVRAAIASVRHFYREVDRLVIGIKEGLRQEPDPLKVVRGSTGKGSNAKQQGRIVLREEYSILFEPEADDDELIVADGADEDDEEDEEEGDTQTTSKRRSAPVELDPDQPLLALRVSLSTSHPTPGFEPSLQYAVLGDWWLGGAKPAGPFAIKRSMLRRLPVALGTVTDPNKRMMTTAKAGKGRVSRDRRVSCRVFGEVGTVALYDLDDPTALDKLVSQMKDHWQNVTEAAAV